MSNWVMWCLTALIPKGDTAIRQPMHFDPSHILFKVSYSLKNLTVVKNKAECFKALGV